MSAKYPPSVASPQIALAASAAHRRGVIRLLLGLLGFATVYLGLLVGCIAAPVLVVVAALSDPWLWLLAGPMLMVFGSLVFVLLRSLAHRPGVSAAAIEVSPTEQPRLFEFLERLAADAGAPMPDRVSLIPGVNAAMLRSPSALGLVFGGPRELVIGLGLVNVLDLRELKAVLAHELGHFAQSSARLGQWAHRTTVLLREIVVGRDRFDEALVRASRSPSFARRAVAAIPLVGVHGIRSILGRLLEGILRSNMALAREMEFNADLHSVALCGSDPIVAALWRAQRGAIAMDSSYAALRELGKHGVLSDDLYAHQDARFGEFADRARKSTDPMIAALRTDYRYGQSLHFPAGEALAEVTWYSHPSYAEREANAKRDYVEAPEQRWPSAWALFDDRAELRRRATAGAYERLGFPQAHDPANLRPAVEVERRLAEELAERAQGRQYFGFYGNRVIDWGDVDALIRAAEAAELDDLRAAVERWRGPRLEAFMQGWSGTEAQRSEAGEGDRAVFCWLWRHASADARSELERRARFLSFVQGHIVTLNHHHAEVVPLLAKIEDLAEVEAALAALHRDVETVLRAAESVELPDLRNLEAGGAVHEFLLGEPLIEWREPGQTLQAWLHVFLKQVMVVHDRLRTLHYKNLGRLLALREAIEKSAELGPKQ